MQDPELQPMFCMWADERWPQFAPTEEVSIGVETRGPYSDVTPDIDPYVAVDIRDAQGRWREVGDFGAIELIGELVRAAAKFEGKDGRTRLER